MQPRSSDTLARAALAASSRHPCGPRAQVGKRTGAVTEVVPEAPDGEIDVAALEAMIACGRPPALVAITHIPTNCGSTCAPCTAARPQELSLPWGRQQYLPGQTRGAVKVSIFSVHCSHPQREQAGLDLTWRRTGVCDNVFWRWQHDSLQQGRPCALFACAQHPASRAVSGAGRHLMRTARRAAAGAYMMWRPWAQ